jgi:TfoX/Sxy family transcriptional regulator of competence genes
MATQPSTVNFLLEQLASAGEVKARNMFGEYALYCDERVVALVCDDKLFLKPTQAGRAFVAEPRKELSNPFV